MSITITGRFTQTGKSITLPTLVVFTPGDRAVIGVTAGGFTSNILEYVTISSTGNSVDFGDLSQGVYSAHASSNGATDRGLINGGVTGTASNFINNIEYVTISSTSDSTDFGDLTEPRHWHGSPSNGVNDRGVSIGGRASGNAATNIMDYVTISTTGNSTDFGDLLVAGYYNSAISNATLERGVFTVANRAGLGNTVEYITISTLSGSTNFGDLSATSRRIGASSNGINDRGVFGGVNGTNVIEYITISSTGNSTDFGDLLADKAWGAGTSNGTNERGLHIAGTSTNVIEYYTIDTPSNTTDFGDISVGGAGGCTTSNA